VTFITVIWRIGVIPAGIAGMAECRDEKQIKILNSPAFTSKKPNQGQARHCAIQVTLL
jgi:hypothetical protein